MNAFDYETDPITAEQVSKVRQLLGERWSEKARDGFLVIAGRFVDETSTDRTEELAPLFRTDSPAGRSILQESLEALFDHVGSLDKFESDYPVYINDPTYGSVGVFPQLPMIGVSRIHANLYRLFDSNANVYGSSTNQTVRDYIIKFGKLPQMKPFSSWILREKPRIYWCSHEKFSTPTEARIALQILDQWNSDCKMRATLPTASLDGLVFVAYSGVHTYPDYVTNLSKDRDTFAGYNVELVASDHPELSGGGMQVGVVGEPKVALLEEWSDSLQEWMPIWQNRL